MKYFYCLFLVFIISCSTERELNKIKLNHPELMSKKAAEWYPCITIGNKIDSTLYKKWITSIDSINSLYVNYKPAVIKTIDTVFVIDSAECVKCQKDFGYISRRLSQANNTISSLNKKILTAPIIHDTIYKLDSARLTNYAEEINRLRNDKDSYVKKNENSMKLSIYFLIALILSVILNIIQFKK